MISLIIDKYFKLKKLTNCRQNDCDFVNSFKSTDIFDTNIKKLNQMFLSKFLFKFNVNAIEINENEVKDNNIDQNNIGVDVEEIGSKEYYEKIKTMGIWDSFQYLIHRKVDTKDENYKEQFIKDGETGLDRVKLIFGEYFNGEDNPEMRFIMSSCGYGLLAGGIYGGILGNRTAVDDFRRRHNEYVFRGDFEAKRQIRDSMYMQFVRAGARWSWRVALFTGGISGLTTVAIAYRNDIYIRDCVISSALICSLWKMKYGLRGMAVSGVVGSIFGALFGTSLKLMLWTFNTTVPEYRHWRHVRYLGHLEVEKYSDGTTEYNWKIDQKDKQKQPDYQNLNKDSTQQ